MKPATAVRLRGLVFRLEPGRTQEAFMGRIGDCCRFMFNWALGFREDVWLAARGAGATGLRCSLGYNQLAGYLGGLKEEYPFLKEAPYHCLQHALRDVDSAFERFFTGKARYPNFRRKGRWIQSFRFPDPKQIEVNGRAIRLPKLGWVKLRRHGRPILGRIRQVTVKCIAGNWQCSVLVEEEYAIASRPTGPDIGLDAGVAQSVALAASDGTTQLVSLPVATPGERSALQRMARTISRRRPGSKRHAKAVRRRQRYNHHILSRVMDSRHKLTTRLAKNHGLIGFEALALKPMTRSARGTVEAPGSNVRQKAALNRVLLEQGMGETQRQLRYKALWNAGETVEVDPAFSSQRCSCCDHVSPENRPSREWFACIACGHAEHADINAARNHLRAAQIMRGGTAVPARGGPPVRGRRSEHLPGRLTRSLVPADPGIPAKIAQAI
jgi:putative transposase